MTYKHDISLFFRNHHLLSLLENPFMEAVNATISCFEKGGKVLLCGNGGSSSDSDHIVGELMKSFEMKRPLSDNQIRSLESVNDVKGKAMAKCLSRGLPAISLSAHTALTTAISNDMGSEYIFAQQVLGYGKKEDILIALSTSGNSENILNGCIAAKSIGITTICFTGATGGLIKDYCDIPIKIPANQTAVIQELTVPLYHLFCRAIETHFFGVD